MKYILLMHYGIEGVAPISEWTPEDIAAHIAFQHQLGTELQVAGEFVDGQGLADPSQAVTVRWDGTSAPVVSDGPFAESKEFLAGYWTVDVDSHARAIEIAAKASAAPGPGGAPLGQEFEVRAVMSAPTTPK